MPVRVAPRRGSGMRAESPIFLRKIRIFVENSVCSADHTKQTGVAYHNPLAACLDQVKAALANFRQEAVPTDLAIDPAQVAPDHGTLLDSLRSEDLIDPEIGACMESSGLHDPTLPDHA
jgi:hypothetical protein